jgi:hypothetical protein
VAVAAAVVGAAACGAGGVGAANAAALAEGIDGLLATVLRA